MFADLMRKKSLDEILAAPEAGHERGLKRNLTAFSLTMLGIGAVIGAGIFSSVGTAAAGGADHLGAGPALMVSFVLTAIACGRRSNRSRRHRATSSLQPARVTASTRGPAELRPGLPLSRKQWVNGGREALAGPRPA